MLRFLGRLGLDQFILLLIAAVAISAVLPAIGKTGGLVHLDLYTNYGVSIVFLIYGLTLSWRKLKTGLLNWRLHLLVVVATFVLYPLLAWAAGALMGGAMSGDLKFGFFYLSASPSTISSSVAMTSIARGNVAGAIFNASLSSLIGVFVTPLWINWYLAQSGQQLALGHVILKILLLVIVPITLGQALRPLIARWIERQTLLVKILDRGTVLAIVFNSVADSVSDGVWHGRGAGLILTVAGGSLAMFFTVFVILEGTCRLLGFDRADTIAGVFCGTKKSLASGIPMAKVMFGSAPAVGMIILPFVVYHFLQLVVASIVARRWAASAPALRAAE